MAAETNDLPLRLPDDQLDFDQNLIFSYKGKRFSGTAYELWPNGQTRSEIVYVDGLQDGVSRDWYASGQINVARSFRRGSLHGPDRSWREDGSLEQEDIREFGVLVKRRIWNANGSLIEYFKLTQSHSNYRILETYRRMAMKNIVDRLIAAKLAAPHAIHGCSESEVASLEDEFKIRFPARYRSFLLTMGHGAGRFLVGTDVFYGDIRGLQDGGLRLLTKEDAALELPDDAFVFLLHQGYWFLFFRVSQGDDPPVYRYFEGEAAPQEQWPSFTDFLLAEIAEAEALRAR